MGAGCVQELACLSVQSPKVDIGLGNLMAENDGLDVDKTISHPGLLTLVE
jgi:hypothetical protein